MGWHNSSNCPFARPLSPMKCARSAQEVLTVQTMLAFNWPAGNIKRIPEGSTHRYTLWVNSLTQVCHVGCIACQPSKPNNPPMVCCSCRPHPHCQEQLYLHRFREVTLLMPTWFMSRSQTAPSSPTLALHRQGVTCQTHCSMLWGRLWRTPVRTCIFFMRIYVPAESFTR